MPLTLLLLGLAVVPICRYLKQQDCAAFACSHKQRWVAVYFPTRFPPGTHVDRSVTVPLFCCAWYLYKDAILLQWCFPSLCTFQTGLNILELLVRKEQMAFGVNTQSRRMKSIFFCASVELVFSRRRSYRHLQNLTDE